MSSDHRRMPPQPREWSDIVKTGVVVFPHPESTKNQLWEWVNEHGAILESLLRKVLDNAASDDNPYLVRELQRIRAGQEQV